jgi:hypothetical protein
MKGTKKVLTVTDMLTGTEFNNPDGLTPKKFKELADSQFSDCGRVVNDAVKKMDALLKERGLCPAGNGFPSKNMMLSGAILAAMVASRGESIGEPKSFRAGLASSPASVAVLIEAAIELGIAYAIENKLTESKETK